MKEERIGAQGAITKIMLSINSRTPCLNLLTNQVTAVVFSHSPFPPGVVNRSSNSKIQSIDFNGIFSQLEGGLVKETMETMGEKCDLAKGVCMQKKA